MSSEDIDHDTLTKIPKKWQWDIEDIQWRVGLRVWCDVHASYRQAAGFRMLGYELAWPNKFTDVPATECSVLAIDGSRVRMHICGDLEHESDFTIDLDDDPSDQYEREGAVRGIVLPVGPDPYGSPYPSFSQGMGWTNMLVQFSTGFCVFLGGGWYAGAIGLVVARVATWACAWVFSAADVFLSLPPVQVGASVATAWASQAALLAAAQRAGAGAHAEHVAGIVGRHNCWRGMFCSAGPMIWGLRLGMYKSIVRRYMQQHGQELPPGPFTRFTYYVGAGAFAEACTQFVTAPFSRVAHLREETGSTTKNVLRALWNRSGSDAFRTSKMRGGGLTLWHGCAPVMIEAPHAGLLLGTYTSLRESVVSTAGLEWDPEASAPRRVLPRLPIDAACGGLAGTVAVMAVHPLRRAYERASSVVRQEGAVETKLPIRDVLRVRAPQAALVFAGAGALGGCLEPGRRECGYGAGWGEFDRLDVADEETGNLQSSRKSLGFAKGPMDHSTQSLFWQMFGPNDHGPTRPWNYIIPTMSSFEQHAGSGTPERHNVSKEYAPSYDMHMRRKHPAEWRQKNIAEGRILHSGEPMLKPDTNLPYDPKDEEQWRMEQSAKNLASPALWKPNKIPEGKVYTIGGLLHDAEKACRSALGLSQRKARDSERKPGELPRGVRDHVTMDKDFGYEMTGGYQNQPGYDKMKPY